MPLRSGSSRSMRSAEAVGVSAAKGWRPVAANTMHIPQEKMSAAGPARSPRSCSGAIQATVPMT